MSSPTPLDPLNEKSEIPISDSPPAQVQAQTKQRNYKADIVLQSLFIILKIIMFVTGVLNVNDCPQQPMVPVYLIISGLLGVGIKLVHIINTKLEVKVIEWLVHILRCIEFIWMLIGCYFVFSIYPPNYSSYFGRMYCDRHSYLCAFALLIMHCTYFVCIVVMKLTNFSTSW